MPGMSGNSARPWPLANRYNCAYMSLASRVWTAIATVPAAALATVPATLEPTSQEARPAAFQVPGCR